MLKAPNGQPWSQYIRVKKVAAAPSPVQPIEPIEPSNKPEPIPEIDLIVRSRPATSHQKTRQPRPQSRAQTTTGSNRRKRKPPSKNPRTNKKNNDSPTKTKAEKAHILSQWLKNKEIEERLRSKKKKKERKQDRQRKREKENLKEKKWAQLCETKRKQQSASTTAVLNTKLTFINPAKRQGHFVVNGDQRNELLLQQLKQAKMQEWYAKKDLEQAQRERKMEEERALLVRIREKKRKEKWKMKY